VATLLIVAVVLGGGAIGLLTILRDELISGVEDSADIRANQVAESARAGELSSSISVAGEEEMLVQVVGQRGNVIAATTNTRRGVPIARFAPGTVNEPKARTIDDPAGARPGPYRVVAVRSSTPAGPVTIYVAATLADADDTIAAVTRYLVISLPVLFALTGAITWFVVGRALRPVESIRRQVTEISGHALDRRVPEPATGDEIGRLARTMNEMLDRLEDSAIRQRRLIADASHELRSPVANIRAALEVALEHAGSVNLRAAAHDALQEDVRMQQLVDDLLEVASTREPGRLRTERVALGDLVRDEADRPRYRGHVVIDTTGVQSADVQGDPEQLRRVLRNLLENAERHAASTVTVSVNRRRDWVELAIADDGPGIAPADRERVFEPFLRLDDARSRTNGGAGLGLTIARDIVTTHAGTIRLADTTAGARIEVRLPASDA
jgi:signal transduction histidine kinase